VPQRFAPCEREEPADTPLDAGAGSPATCTTGDRAMYALRSSREGLVKSFAAHGRPTSGGPALSRAVDGVDLLVHGGDQRLVGESARGNRLAGSSSAWSTGRRIDRRRADCSRSEGPLRRKRREFQDVFQDPLRLLISRMRSARS
jgi:ABC-type microcin C transport system duplicated ATPase subunit YejF